MYFQIHVSLRLILDRVVRFVFHNYGIKPHSGHFEGEISLPFPLLPKGLTCLDGPVRSTCAMFLFSRALLLINLKSLTLIFTLFIDSTFTISFYICVKTNVYKMLNLDPHSVQNIIFYSLIIN